jgi:nitroreductase
MMDVIKARRAVRAYKDEAVDDAMITELLEAATWAPSGSNVQPWHFVVVTDKTVREQIDAFSPGMFGKPPVVIAMCTDRQRAFEKAGPLGRDELAVMDICMASQNLMLMAASKGLGTCPIRSFSRPAISKILNLPSQITPDLLISVGYPSKPANAPKRKPVSEVAHYNSWEGMK